MLLQHEIQLKPKELNQRKKIGLRKIRKDFDNLFIQLLFMEFPMCVKF